MLGSRTAWRRIACLVGGLCVGGAVALPNGLWAETAAPFASPIAQANKDKDNGKKDDKNDNGKKDGKDETKGAGTALPAHLAGVPVLDLSACKSVALTKQPAIAAALASYQAALARQNSLNTVHVPNFLARDLPVRKTQASL